MTETWERIITASIASLPATLFALGTLLKMRVADGKLDLIHGSVNSNLAAVKAELATSVAETKLLREEVDALLKKNSTPPP